MSAHSDMSSSERLRGRMWGFFSERDIALKKERTTLLRAHFCTSAMLEAEIQNYSEYKYWFISRLTLITLSSKML